MPQSINKPMWFDISRSVQTGQLTYPGDPPVTVDVLPGNGTSVHRLCLTTHSGTHVDAPSHLGGGGQTIDEVGWDQLFLTAQVVRVRSSRIVSVREVAPVLMPAVGAVLFRTRNEELPRDVFCPQHIFLEPRLATLLAQRGARLVGIDYLSVDPPGSLEAHHALLHGGVLVLEDIDLRGIAEGLYQLICLPLKVAGGDGAPCRALLGPVGEKQ